MYMHCKTPPLLLSCCTFFEQLKNVKDISRKVDQHEMVSKVTNKNYLEKLLK
jgi:hypothetical protein